MVSSATQLDVTPTRESQDPQTRAAQQPHGAVRGQTSVVCICSGIGFPHGQAPASRIRLVGRATLAGGVDFSVIHLGSSPHFDHDLEGVVDGIPYRYLLNRKGRSRFRLRRVLSYIHGALLALRHVRRMRAAGRRPSAYLWVSGPIGMAMSLVFRLQGIPIVLEVSEWWPGRFARWQRRISQKIAQGTIAISRPIVQRLKEFGLSRHEVICVPILTDCEKWKPDEQAKTSDTGAAPYLLWCGSVAGYRRDVSFMLKALGMAHQQGFGGRLMLVGARSEATLESILAEAESYGLSRECVEVPGFLSEEELKRAMWNARALLLPMWEDERSECRFPTKLGEYLGTGTPVITCPIGDLGHYLQAEQSAYFYTPGSAEDLGRVLLRVVQDKEQAIRVGLGGQAVAQDHFDYRNYIDRFADFFCRTAVARG